MPMALVGLAIKLALVIGTPVFPFGRFVALRFLGVPLAIWIVCANELIDFVAAWNDAFVFAFTFVSETEAGADEQYDKGGKGGEVLHRIISPKHSTSPRFRELTKKRLVEVRPGSDSRRAVAQRTFRGGSVGWACWRPKPR